jgi:hypothetical protein
MEQVKIGAAIALQKNTVNCPTVVVMSGSVGLKIFGKKHKMADIEFTTVDRLMMNNVTDTRSV